MYLWRILVFTNQRTQKNIEETLRELSTVLCGSGNLWCFVMATIVL